MGARRNAQDILLDLLYRLVGAQEQSALEAERRERGRIDVKLKLEQKLCRIKANSSETILEEVEGFEEQMRRNEIGSWRMVYRYFEAALEDKAREWIEGWMLYEPGRTRRWRRLQPGALDADWGNLYRIARVELYRRVGTQYESPGDQAQAAWDAVVFHDKVVTKMLSRP